MQVVPAILTNDPQELDKLLRGVRGSKKFERVQIDFIDGEFANNKTLTPLRLQGRLRWGLEFDAHLMVTERNINRYVLEAREVGFDRIIVQMESVSRPEDFMALALDVHSPIEAIKPYLPKLGYVIVMSVEPGFGGQEFVDKAITHVRELGEIREIGGYKYKICVDGGVDQEHLEILEKMGVDEVAVGAKRVLSW